MCGTFKVATHNVIYGVVNGVEKMSLQGYWELGGCTCDHLITTIHCILWELSWQLNLMFCSIYNVYVLYS